MAQSRGMPVSALLKKRSLGTLGFAAVAAFYIAWPMYAGYEIKSSLDSQNVDGLNAKVDFPSVRVSLKPAVTEKVDQVITDALRRAGTMGGALTDQIKAKVVPRVVDGVLAVLVTPETMIRIHATGKSLKDALDSIVRDRAAKAQGLLLAPPGGDGGKRSRLDEVASGLGIDTSKVFGGAVATDVSDPVAVSEQALPLSAAGGQKPKYGLGNLKHFSFTGPLGLSVGLSRDAVARKSEFTAELAFVDGSWKLVGLVPGE